MKPQPPCCRNIDYILSCCAVPVTEEHVCVITDHQLLHWPGIGCLYMIIISVAEQASEQMWKLAANSMAREGQQVIRGHVLWMFERLSVPIGTGDVPI